MRRTVVALVVFVLYACATATPPPPIQPEVLRGVASWYGQEFAGRTTANGEIFDPLLFTAAHRTLPFGTLIEVRNPNTNESVRVRINDRGPYIGNRILDLSYAAAKQISLVEPGSGDVELTVIKVGKGDREPPAPYVVTVPDVKATPVAATEPPPVAFPLPDSAGTSTVVDNVQVVEEHHGVETRRQVSADGRTVENVPVGVGQAAVIEPPRRTITIIGAGKFVVQVGAFAQESNAKQLLGQLNKIGQQAYIDRTELFRVRIGPFPTRDAAIRVRAQLETAGMSAIVVAQ
jgi:rare lipoprotein A (peptidoglycan hydrolase)